MSFFSAWVVIGKPRPDNAKAYTEAGFEGKITKVQIWNRGLDFTNEIQKQVSYILNILYFKN